jgi:hypothetical protein
MGTDFDDGEEVARGLSLRRAALDHQPIEEPDSAVELPAEQLWVDEAEHRHRAYLNGELEVLPGDEVMLKARNRLKLVDPE